MMRILVCKHGPDLSFVQTLSDKEAGRLVSGNEFVVVECYEEEDMWSCRIYSDPIDLPATQEIFNRANLACEEIPGEYILVVHARHDKVIGALQQSFTRPAEVVWYQKGGQGRRSCSRIAIWRSFLTKQLGLILSAIKKRGR